MYQNIATFMEEAHRAMNGAGAFFSADVFGYATWAPQGNHVAVIKSPSSFMDAIAVDDVLARLSGLLDDAYPNAK